MLPSSTHIILPDDRLELVYRLLTFTDDEEEEVAERSRVLIKNVEHEVDSMRRQWTTRQTLSELIGDKIERTSVVDVDEIEKLDLMTLNIMGEANHLARRARRTIDRYETLLTIINTFEEHPLNKGAIELRAALKLKIRTLKEMTIV